MYYEVTDSRRLQIWLVVRGSTHGLHYRALTGGLIPSLFGLIWEKRLRCEGYLIPEPRSYQTQGTMNQQSGLLEDGCALDRHTEMVVPRSKHEHLQGPRCNGEYRNWDGKRAKGTLGTHAQVNFTPNAGTTSRFWHSRPAVESGNHLNPLIPPKMAL
jgi:hypothetical protein